ncbi:phosphoadenosine phosphosulfate reductase [Vibrio parahaemolyticus]|nr:phosphoadenosine phosphosulfate reductase [Vibrio parahaemolyticus]
MAYAALAIDIKELDAWDTWADELSHSDLEITPLVMRSVEAIYNYLKQGFTYQIQYSAGKDSETVLGLFLLALTKAKREGIPISEHHFLVHVDTGIENPEVRTLADSKMAALNSFIEAHNLPLKTYIARPSLASAWASRIIGGRGLPTFVSTKFRQCTWELKITGANRVVSQHKKTMPKTDKQKIIMLLGSRVIVTIRANNIAKLGGDEVTLSKSGNKYSLYPIKTWLSSQVWEFLTYSGTRSSSVLPSYMSDHFKTVDLYRDSGAGECVVFQTDDQDGGSGQSSCGSRHGCAFCLAAGIDKSMETLLATDPERYSYMIGLNRIQRYLELTRHDWSLRHPVGRTIYDAGYIKIQPDVYSPDMLKRLLHAVISYDYLEQKRASELEEKLVNGQVEDNEHNRRFSQPQFQIIDERQLIAIEFLWGLHHFQKLPFEALDIWHKVYTHHELELLEEVDTMTAVPKSKQPKPFWLKVDEWGDGSDMDGLSDFWTELTYFDSNADQTHRVINTNEGDRRVVDYVEGDLFDVDQDAAEFIVWNEYPALNDNKRDGFYTPYYSTAYLLRFGAVQLGKGQSARYHMAQRGQTYHALGLTGERTMDDIANDEKLKHLIIDDVTYKPLSAAAKEIKDRLKAEEKAREEEQKRLEKKRKAWAKKHPKQAKEAKRLKVEISIQRTYEHQFKTLFTMTTSIHAQMQNEIRKGLDTKSIVDVLGNLRNEISELRERQNETFHLKSTKFQLNANKYTLFVLNEGCFDMFESDHIREYATHAPEQLRKELEMAIYHLESVLANHKPKHKKAPWYEGNGKKAPCPLHVAKVAQAATATMGASQLSMNLEMFMQG